MERVYAFSRRAPPTLFHHAHSSISPKQKGARPSAGRLPILLQRSRIFDFDPSLPDTQPQSHNAGQETDKQPRILEDLGLEGINGFDSLANVGLLIEDGAETEKIGGGNGVS